MSILFCTMTIFSTPLIVRAIRCSFVCGWGHFSFAAMSSNAPFIMAAPESIVAISVSCPGASTNETVLSNFASEPHTGHVDLMV